MFILDTVSYIFSVKSKHPNKDLQDKIFRNFFDFSTLDEKDKLYDKVKAFPSSICLSK